MFGLFATKCPVNTYEKTWTECGFVRWRTSSTLISLRVRFPQGLGPMPPLAVGPPQRAASGLALREP
jgi:hypothetical protein